MGTRGPAPSAAELRLLKGKGGGQDIAGRPVKRQPRAVPGVPPMPDDFGEDAERMWKHITPELARMGYLGRVDLLTLEALCRTYGVWKKHDGGLGYPTLTMTLVNIGSKLGLDPMSRMRMVIPEAGDDEEGNIFGSG